MPTGTGNLPKDSKVKADQIQTLDNVRILKFIGKLDSEEMNRIDEAVKIHLRLN